MLFFRFCNAYAKFLHSAMVVLMMSLLFAVTLQVAGRYVPFIPRYLWALEVSNFSLIWLIFLGSIIGLREKRHFFVDVFEVKGPRLRPSFTILLRILYYAVLLVVIYIFTFYGYQYFMRWGLIQSSDITGINLGWLYASVPVAGLSWLMFVIEGILKEIFRVGAPERVR